jgi:hypothetical protein
VTDSSPDSTTVAPQTELALIALLACLVPTVLLLRRAARTGQIRPRPTA